MMDTEDENSRELREGAMDSRNFTTSRLLPLSVTKVENLLPRFATCSLMTSDLPLVYTASSPSSVAGSPLRRNANAGGNSVHVNPIQHLLPARHRRQNIQVNYTRGECPVSSDPHAMQFASSRTRAQFPVEEYTEALHLHPPCSGILTS